MNINVPCDLTITIGRAFTERPRGVLFRLCQGSGAPPDPAAVVGLLPDRAPLRRRVVERKGPADRAGVAA
jgi:hypothetical protein